MVNIMTKKTAKAILYVYTHDIKEKLTDNEIAKNKLVTLLNNVIQIAYQRSISPAQMYQNICEALDYISDYIKMQCKGTDYIFTYFKDPNDENTLHCKYGLINDNLQFTINVNKSFKKMRG